MFDGVRNKPMHLRHKAWENPSTKKRMGKKSLPEAKHCKICMAMKRQAGNDAVSATSYLVVSFSFLETRTSENSTVVEYQII